MDIERFNRFCDEKLAELRKKNEENPLFYSFAEGLNKRVRDCSIYPRTWISEKYLSAPLDHKKKLLVISKIRGKIFWDIDPTDRELAILKRLELWRKQTDYQYEDCPGQCFVLFNEMDVAF